MNRWIRMRMIVLAFCLAAGPALHASTAAKKTIGYDAYDGWRSIRNTRLSRDGVWLVYALVPEDGDGELVVRNLETGAERRQARGADPVLTADGKFVVFRIAPLKSEIDKAKKAKKKPEDQPKSGLGVMNLSTGEVFTAERVKSFKVPEEGGDFVAWLLEPEKRKPAAKEKEEPSGEQGKKKEKKKESGTEMVVRDLGTGAQTSVAEVSEYVWAKDGSLLAYGVSSTIPEKDGAYVRNVHDGRAQTLLAGQGNYKGFAFDEKGKQLAFVSDRDDYASQAPAYRLYYWSSGAAGASEIVSGATPGFPSGDAVSEDGRLEFSKDGSLLYFGTAPAPEAEAEDAPEPVKVDIWNYHDALLQPMQKVRADEEKKRSYRAVYRIADRKFVQLASREMPDVAIPEKGVTALGTSDVPYRQLISWDGRYGDIYLVDLRDGSKKKIVDKLHFRADLSPEGGYVLYFDDHDNNWYTIRVRDGRKTNLTGKLSVAFQDETWDTPDQPGPYGSAGWTAGDGSVLLYDRYDIWEVRPDGSAAHMLTRGAGRSGHLVFRYLKLDPEEKAIPADRSLLLQTVDDDTKASGIYRTRLTGDDAPAEVVMLDKAFGRSFVKAKNAPAIVFTLSRFDEFPDLWVTHGDFTDMKKVSDANPQQAEYNWGKAELIDYRNADGRMLKAVLIKPEDFDASRQYPMMVYIYEELTSGLHRYHAPGPGTSINITRYVSNGYVVLMPDIVYATGYPGESAFKCVIPAVQKVLDMGFVDPKRVGIQGHSWGGYEISYLITRTDMFAAVEAGASVVNMISAYGGIRWGTGMSRAFQYEKTQSRIGGPPWDDTLEYIENSPIFWVEKVHTPYLTIHNDADDAVPWYQGIEFFSALRRLGKEAYMFVYNGEKHGLRQRENQKHWTVHMDEFFDHYLKGAPLPEWMSEGVPYLERGRRNVDPLYEPAAVTGDPRQ